MIELSPGDTLDIVYKLQTRALIRRQITSRTSVQEGKPDRISDLLEDAARVIIQQRAEARLSCFQKFIRWMLK